MGINTCKILKIEYNGKLNTNKAGNYVKYKIF